MSEKEIAMNLLENVPSYKLGYVIAYLQGLTADEAADDAFCEQLLKDYENDKDKGHFISMEEMTRLSAGAARASAFGNKQASRRGRPQTAEGARRLFQTAGWELPRYLHGRKRKADSTHRNCRQPRRCV